MRFLRLGHVYHPGTAPNRRKAVFQTVDFSCQVFLVRGQVQAVEQKKTNTGTKTETFALRRESVDLSER